MKRVIFSSSLVLLFIGITSLAPSTQFKYSSSEGKLSIVFPDKFTTEENVGDQYKTIKTQALYNDILFFVAYTVHTTELTDNEGLTKVSLDSFIGGLEANVTKESMWKVRKNKGLQASFNIVSQGLKGEYRIVLIGQIQYQIAVVGAEDAWSQTLADSFIKSCKITK